MSLKVKILIISLIFILLIFGLILVNNWYYSLQTMQTVSAEKRRQGKLIRDWLKPFLQQGNWLEIRRRLLKSQTISAWTIAEKTQEGLKIVSSSTQTPQKLDTSKFLFASQSNRIIIEKDDIYIPIGTENKIFVAKIVFAPDVVKGSQPAEMLRNTLILMGVGSVFILICLYILLNIFVLRPLEKLRIYCQKLLQRDYSAKPQYPQSYDEISKLYEAYGQIKKELQKYEIEKEEINKRAENVLLSAQRLASSGMLLSEIAHEINNPLGGIINAVDVLKDGKLSEPKKKQYFELITDGLERIKKTVSRVLFMHRSGEPKGLIDIPLVINNAVMFADYKAKKKGVRIINEVEQELPKVLGNSTELQQTFLNILLNAVDACVIDEGVITITSSTDKDRVKISIRDNGHGMSPQEIKLCKEPFFTTKEDFGGTGLGLVIANKIIQNHGGGLDIQSQIGVGTTITISLPKVR